MRKMYLYCFSNGLSAFFAEGRTIDTLVRASIISSPVMPRDAGGRGHVYITCTLYDVGMYYLEYIPPIGLFVEIPEGALDKFRGGAEEFIAGTRVFPPKSGTLNIL